MARLDHGVEWRFEATPEEVWKILADYQRWPTWWNGIQSVERIAEGGEDGVGTILRQRWRSRLPVTLCFDLEMLRIEVPKLLAGRASGDLEGSCTWTVAEEDAGLCRVRFDVDVQAGRWWMRLPVPLADQVFRANFDAVMDWGREGLERTLHSRDI